MDHSKAHPAEATTRENGDLAAMAERLFKTDWPQGEWSKYQPGHAAYERYLKLAKVASSTHQQQGAESELVKRLRSAANNPMPQYSIGLSGLLLEAADALSRAPQPDSSEAADTTPLASTVTEAIAKYDAQVEAAGPCSDGNCMIRKPVGQHTNGGCRCSSNSLKAQRMMIAGRELRAALSAKGK